MTTTTKNQEIILDLYKHDLAACDIYREVLKHITDTNIADRIKEYLSDHERHVEDLSNALDKISEGDVDKSRDIKGFLLAAYTKLRSVTGQDGALHALQTAEEILLKRYQEAAKENLDSEFLDLIESNLHDEEEHNNYVNSLLQE